MKETLVTVFSSDETSLLEALRPASSEFRFEAPAPKSRSRIALLDGAEPGSETFAARILLTSPGEAHPHAARRGDLVVSRSQFLQSPRSYLDICRELSERQELVESLQRELTFLEQIPSLAAMNDPARVSELITRTVLDVVRLEKGTLLLHDVRSERFLVSFTNAPPEPDLGAFVPGIDPEMLQKALQQRSYALKPSTEQSGGVLIIPIEVEEDLIAVLKLLIPAGEVIDENDAASAMRYVANVTAVLGNVYQLTRNRELAMRDDLTKAFNRRFFESYLDEEIERSRRYGTYFSIIFLDLDDLKTVNDQYGHLAGSRTLQEVAKRILGAIRGIDKLVRFGGDEFCIILPQTDQQQARAVAARVQRALFESPFRLEPTIEVGITASFGVATYPLHALGKEDLVKTADAAMYRVKSTTKNAIGMAGEPLPQRPAAPRVTEGE